MLGVLSLSLSRPSSCNFLQQHRILLARGTLFPRRPAPLFLSLLIKFPASLIGILRKVLQAFAAELLKCSTLGVYPRKNVPCIFAASLYVALSSAAVCV
jgi:hypothetical protein